MNRRSAFLSVAVFLCAWIGEACEAGVVISIDQKTAIAGETILMGVYASSDSGDIINGFNLPFDYNSDGLFDSNNDGVGELPVGFSFTANGGLTNVLFVNTVLSRPLPQISLISVDTIVTGSGPNIQLSNLANATKLFDIGIQVAPNVPVGTVLPFQIKIPGQPFTSLFNVSGPNSPTVISPTLVSPSVGSLTIVAVPEPNCAALFALAGAMAVGLGCFRHRRKRA